MGHSREIHRKEGEEQEARQDWEAREVEDHWTRCWDQYRGWWTPEDLREVGASH